jgi:hypothetical protein
MLAKLVGSSLTWLSIVTGAFVVIPASPAINSDRDTHGGAYRSGEMSGLLGWIEAKGGLAGHRLMDPNADSITFCSCPGSKIGSGCFLENNPIIYEQLKY